MKLKYWQNRFLQMKKGIVKVAALSLIGAAMLVPNAISVQAETRQVEDLDRGLVAVKVSDGVYLSWRLLGSEEYDTAFNVYRNGTKIAGPITDSTNYKDTSGSVNAVYTVRKVVDGQEKTESEQASVWANEYLDVPIEKPADFTMADGTVATYSANDATVADVDADGAYEIILKWDPSNSQDNSKQGYTANVYVDCYEMDGTKKWRIDLGKNIRAGAHYTQMIAYDLNGDGKAEVAMKTADGTVAGDGTVIGDASADYRNSSGYILDGPEYLTLFEGATGKILTTIDYEPARGTVSSWGDKYGNRVDRFLAGVAYTNGRNPSLIVCRGYYTRAVIVSYKYRNGTLNKEWTFDTNSSENSAYAGQGNHNLSMADVDGDGCDEIVYGSAVIDHDGKGLYTTGDGHGDAMHVGDFDPDHEGLEVFQVHETKSTDIEGVQMRDAKTGTTLWSDSTGTDVGRGLIVNIGPDYYPYVATTSAGNYDKNGNKLDLDLGKFGMNFAIWWDSDLYREGLDRTYINKWNYNTKSIDRLLTASDVHSNNSTKANPSLSGDILGDWREEVIWPTSDDSALRIYIATSVTEHKLYTLVHDVQYRESLAWQNVAYNQPPHTSYYMGEDMPTPTKPDVWPTGKYEEKEIGTETTETREKELVAKYSFESSSNGKVTDETGHGYDLTLYGNAACSQDAERGNALYLTGETGTYGQFPEGMFNGISDMTVSMNVKSESSGYFFNFALGRDDTSYYFNKVSTSDVRSAITVNGWENESTTSAELDGSVWHNYTFVLNGTNMEIYVDGVLTSSTTMNQTISDLGSNLTAYIGKSFFENDSYFKGWTDNLEIYSYALSSEEVASLSAKNFPAVHTHTFGDWEKNALSHWKSCSCGEKQEESTHTFGEWQTVKEPTCSQAGESVRSCNICGYQETVATEITDGGHSIDTSVWQSDSSSHWHVCSECNQPVDAQVHNMDWIVDKEATATEEGSRHQQCLVCGYIGVYENIPMLGDTSSTTENPGYTTEDSDNTAQNPGESTEDMDNTAQNPGESTEDSNNTTQNPGDVNDTTQDSNGTTQNPDDATYGPGNSTQNPSDNPEDENDTTQDSDGTTQNPDDATYGPGNSTQNPSDNPGDENDTTQDSDGTTQNPDDATYGPGNSTQNPSDNTGDVNDTTQDSDGTTQNPDDATYGPGNSTQNPSDNTGDVNDTTQDSDGTTQNPNDATYGPGNSTQNPSDNTGDVNDTTQDSDGTTQNPGENTEDSNNTTQNPSDSTQNSTGSNQNPSDNTQNSTGSSQYPNDSTQNSTGSSQYPNDSTQDSTGSSQNPSDNTQNSTGSSQYPNDSTQDSTGSSQNPSDSTQNSTGTSQYPNDSTQNSSGSSQYPNDSTQDSTGTSQYPNDSTQDSSGSSQYPNDSTQDSTGTSQYPSDSTQAPSGSSQNPSGTTQNSGATTQNQNSATQTTDTANSGEHIIESSLQINSFVYDSETNSNAIYQITKLADQGMGEVTYVTCTDKTISKVVIPNTVTIGDKVYKVTAIADNAFKANKKLKQVTIGNYVKVIGKNAFRGCKVLKKVVIGKQVKTIKKQAFYQCKKLNNIQIKSAKLKVAGKKAFSGIAKKATIKVPKNKKKQYKKLLKQKVPATVSWK